MTATYSVLLRSVTTVDDIPSRFPEAGIRELIEALGGGTDDEIEVDAALRAAIEAVPFQDMAEQLLDLLLLQPPIPAYCESLVRRMDDVGNEPWRDHDVAGDRFSLWYAHRLLHRAMPERWTSPSCTRVELLVVALEPGAALPGPRSAPHDRTAFAGSLLAAAGGPLASRGDDVSAWAYDVLWAVEVGSRSPVSPDAAAALQAPSGAPSVGVTVWLPPDLVAPSLQGTSWTLTAAAR